MFTLWIIPYSLFGAKWLRYTLGLIPFVYMIAAVGIAALVRSVSAFSKGANAERALRYASALAILIFIAWPAWTAYANRPHYAAYTNAFGGGRVGYFFPHDEFYDDGLREAIEFICKTAPQGATIAHETPGVLNNPGAHGFSEILYAFSSMGNNNGSAFGGLTASKTFFATAGGICMFVARYWIIVPVLAIAGSLARKKIVPASSGTLPTDGALFVVLLAGTVILVGALTYVPALALGPVVEHLRLAGGAP